MLKKATQQFTYTITASFLGILTLEAATTNPDTVGYWRFDEAEAVADGDILTTITEANSPTLNGTKQGGGVTPSPKWNTDVPDEGTLDPVTGEKFENKFSCLIVDNARFRVNNNDLLNTETGFTAEFFAKANGPEWQGFAQFIRRHVSASNRWLVQIHHGTTVNDFGSIASQFDMGGRIDIIDSSTGPDNTRIFVDTDTASGDPADYDDPSDVFMDGDGINDNPQWYHVALTLDVATGDHELFINYESIGTATTPGPYAHPDQEMRIGSSFQTGQYIIDEVRYSSRILAPNEFLQAVKLPEPRFYAMLFGILAIGLCIYRKRKI